MSHPFLLQLSGAPGAGKSTMARALARARGAVVLDHDVLKSTLLAQGLAPGAGDPIDDPEDLAAGPAGAGPAAYALAFALAAELLAAGRGVVLDSPCYYQELLERGQATAAAARVPYLYAECVTADLDELARRLAARHGLASQCAGLAPASAGPAPPTLAGRALFEAWIAGMRRPARGGGYLRLDTGRPVAACLADLLALIDRAGT